MTPGASPVVVAVNCCVCDDVSVGASGLMLTLGDCATSETVAKLLVLPSAALVAITCTVTGDGTVAGAVYKPFTMLPVAGFKDQFTAVLLVPVTVALNCCDWPAESDIVPGLTVTLIGAADKETVAVAILVGSATLVAVIAIVCAAPIVEGAV